VADLESASAVLPDKAFTSNVFRVSRPTALTLLADVYLTMSGWPLRGDYYRQAAETARHVIQGGSHSLLSNDATPDKSAWNKFRVQNDNTECVYSYKIKNTGRSLIALSLPEEATSWGVVKTATIDAYMPSPALMNIYDQYVDTRGQEQQFFHSFVKYERNERTVFQTFRAKPHWWFDKNAMFETGVTSKDVAIYRYAEVLLIAAEAIAMTDGVTSEAVNYLTDIRSRAWPSVDRGTIRSELSALNVDEFIEEVWAERLREFPLEMKIWPDIQRTRKYPLTSSEGTGKITFVDVVGAPNQSGASFKDEHLLLPMPKK
jgi:hypothetical protein